jgi:hypothetical protein
LIILRPTLGIIMTSGQLAYLILVVVAFAAFSGVLAAVSSRD